MIDSPAPDTDRELPYSYMVYGLNIASSAAIPGLIPASESDSADVRIYLDNNPDFPVPITHEVKWYRHPDKDFHGNTLFTVWQLNEGDFFRVQFGDGTQFVINRSGSMISATWPDKLTLQEVISYIYGSILGLVLKLRNIVALHASAILIDDSVIALLGRSGSGKSTTAAALAERGNVCLTDDLVVLKEISDKFYVQPGYPRIKLWPEAVDLLYGSQNALPPLLSGTTYWKHWDKRYLDLTQDGYAFAQGPHPLNAIYIFESRQTDPAAPYIDSLPPSNVLITLVANMPVRYVIDRELHSLEFEALSNLVNNVHIRSIQPHSDPEKLGTLCDLLIRDAKSLSTG